MVSRPAAAIFDNTTMFSFAWLSAALNVLRSSVFTGGTGLAPQRNSRSPLPRHFPEHRTTLAATASFD
jgi:hypothetical protein